MQRGGLGQRHREPLMNLVRKDKNGKLRPRLSPRCLGMMRWPLSGVWRRHDSVKLAEWVLGFASEVGTSRMWQCWTLDGSAVRAWQLWHGMQSNVDV